MGKRHLLDVVKMLWHLSFPRFTQPLTLFSLVYSIYDFIFPSVHAHFPFPLLPLICTFRSVFETLLFCSSSPRSRLFFSSQQRLQRSRSVQFCHISLSSLCVFVPECLLYTGLCKLATEIDYTIALWLYNSCWCGYLDSEGEASFVYGKHCLRRAPCPTELEDFARHGKYRLNSLCLTCVTYHLWKIQVAITEGHKEEVEGPFGHPSPLVQVFEIVSSSNMSNLT